MMTTNHYLHTRTPTSRKSQSSKSRPIITVKPQSFRHSSRTPSNLISQDHSLLSSCVSTISIELVGGIGTS